MTGNNNNLIPKENYKKVEEVRGIDNKYEVPSFEEFMKTYEPSEEVEILVEAEYQDRILHGPQYGPGNEQSRTVAKTGTGIGIALLTVVCPPAGIGVAAGTVVAGAGIVAGAKAQGDEEAANLGVELIGIGATGAISGGVGLSAHAKNGCSLPLTFCKK